MARQEAEQNAVDLPDDEPEIFKRLVQYIYEGEYSPAMVNAQSEDSTTMSYKSHSDFGPESKERKNYTYGGQYFGANQGYTNSMAPGDPTELLIHAKMYEIADKYDVYGLKSLVIEKFRRACQAFWNTTSFTAAAHHAYTTTPEHDKGLRDIVSKTIAKHMVELVRNPEIEALLTELNRIAYSLLQAKVQEGWH